MHFNRQSRAVRRCRRRHLNWVIHVGNGGGMNSMQPTCDQRHYVAISCTEFDSHRSRNMEIKDINSFRPTTKV